MTLVQETSVESSVAKGGRAERAPATGAAATWERWMRFLARYHSCEVVGVNHVPKTGGVVFAGTHSLASYDLFIVSFASIEFTGRRVLIVGDDLMFKVPGLAKPLREIGFISGRREVVMEKLRQGEMIGIAPGGMKESLRSSQHRYEFDWSSRKGFAHVAMKAGVPVLPAVCPQADHIYTVYENPLTPWVYRHFKVPIPFFTGRALSPLPRPVKLVHVVGKPLYPDVAPDQATDEDVKRFHERIVRAVKDLMEEARAMGDQAQGDDIRRFG